MKRAKVLGRTIKHLIDTSTEIDNKKITNTE